MPAASKKGASKAANRDRRSNSRHSTPVSALTETSAPPTPLLATPTTATAPSLPKETEYLHTLCTTIVSDEPSIETLVDSTSSNLKSGDPPTARELHSLHDRIKDGIAKVVSRRGEICDRSIRQLAQKRKERLQLEREQEAAQEAEAARIKREEDDGDRKKSKKLSKKRSHDEMDVDQDEQDRKEKNEALPSVGAHGVARQDGVGVHQGVGAPPSPPVQPGTAAIDPMDTAESPSDSEKSEPSAPPSTIPLYERAFGKDPTKTEDPTIYDIRPLHDDMSDEEKRAILNVLHWPESDLRHMTAGDPPDMDFSNTKPANQVNFSTFQTSIEPYIRPFTEEDVAFLKERGDRFTPYVIPQRGSKGYKDVWAAEDGLTGIEAPRPPVSNPNEARGSMEDMDDATAETDEISMGPIMNRLLSIVRPQQSTAKKGDDETDANGDTSMVNGDDTTEQTALSEEQQKPTTYLPPDAPRPANLPQLDYEGLEQRAIQELRHIGFLAPNESPNVNSHNDDEVSARLRTLQHELRRVSRTNNVRKARVLELTEERMAMQEYANIADDLDNQVNAAYLKRNRSLAKPNNKKGSQHRPGQKGVAGALAGRGVSDGVRALMQKRRDWIDMVGPVISYGRPPIPGDDETIFDEAAMRRLEKVEKEAEAGDAEGE